MELAKAYVQIIPSAKGMNGMIRDELDDEARSAGESAGKTIGSRIKSALVAAGIGKVIQSVFSNAINEGGMLQQSIGGIETLFKDSADQVKIYANEAFETVGLSANEYMQQVTSFSASLLQSLDGDTAKAAEYANRAMIDMGDNANKMGTSMESIQNAYQGFAKQNYTMLDNLKLGYGGTKEEMSRLISDASKMTDIQNKLNVTVQDGDMSFGNIVNAISVMQSQLGITGTTADEAARTIEGSFNAMKASAKNLLANMTLGEDIKPSLKNLVDTTGIYLKNNLFPAIGNIITLLPSALGGLVNVGIKGGADLVRGLTDGLSGNVSSFIKEALPTVLKFTENLRENAGELVDAGMDMLLQLVQGWTDAFPDLIAQVPLIISNIAGIINDNMPKILETGFNILVTLGKGLISAIPDVIANMGSIIQAIFDVWQAINWIELGKNLIDGIKNGIKNAYKSLKENVSNWFKDLQKNVETIFNDTLASASNIWNAVKNAIVNFVNQSFSSVSTIFTNMKNGIVDIFTGIKATANSIWYGIKNTIATVVNGIKLSVEGVFNGIKNFISTCFNGIKKIASDVWNGIKNAITTPMETAKSLVKGIIDAIKGFFDFKISWPKIPLPHFSISPSNWGIGDLLKGKIPSLGISWYAKAVDEPMMLDKASIFGISNGNLLGGGETQREYITGEPGLKRIVSQAIDEKFNLLMNKQMSMLDMIIALLKIIVDKNPTIVLDDGTLIGKIIDEINQQLYYRKLAGDRGL